MKLVISKASYLKIDDKNMKEFDDNDIVPFNTSQYIRKIQTSIPLYLVGWMRPSFVLYLVRYDYETLL